MAFRITTGRDSEHMNNIPGDLNGVNRYGNNISVQEYSNSRLLLRNNVQFYLAMSPLTMQGRRFYIRTYKESWASAEAFSYWYEHYFVDLFRNGVRTGAPYHHQILIFNTDGAWNKEELFRIVDEKHKIQRMLVSACTLSTGHTIRIIKAPDKEFMYVFTSNVNHGVLLKLASILPLIFPSLAPDKIQHGIDSAYPIDLFIKLGNLDYDGYMNLFREWWSKSESERQRAQMLANLNGLAEGYITSQKQRIEQEMHTYHDHIEAILNNARQAYEAVNDLLRKSNALDAADNPMLELVEYLRKKKDIWYVERYGNRYDTLFFLAVQPVNIIDVDGLREYAKSTYRNTFNEPDSLVARMFDDVFIKQKYTLWTQVWFWINFHDFTMKAENPSRACTVGIPNTHLIAFNCWGNNKPHIIKALGEHDYVVALEQALAACRALNIHDSAVMRRLREHILSGDPQYYEMRALQDVETKEWLTLRQYQNLRRE